MMYYNTHYIAVATENEVKDDWKMFEIPTLLVYAYTMAVWKTPHTFFNLQNASFHYHQFTFILKKKKFFKENLF